MSGKCNSSACPHCESDGCNQIAALREKLERLENTGDSNSPMIASLKHIILEWISAFEAARNSKPETAE